MEIKLRAKLTAYSRAAISSGEGSGGLLPTPTPEDEGAVLGVENSQYNLFPSATEKDIDELFKDILTDDVVTSSDIDALFPELE